MVQRERLREKIAEAPRYLSSIPGVTRNTQIRSEFAHRLPARPARRRRLVRFRRDCDFLEVGHPPRNRRRNRDPLSAKRLAIGRVLDVASGDYLAAGREHRRTHAKS